MDPYRNGIADHQRQALDFMLDALGLQHVRDEAHRAARLMELEQQVPALLSENRRLRRRVAELERELNPDENGAGRTGRSDWTAASPASTSVASTTSDPVWPSGDITLKGGQTWTAPSPTSSPSRSSRSSAPRSES